MNEPLSIAMRLESAILGRSDLDVTERRRRIFVTLAVISIVPAILVPDFTGVFELDTAEIIIDSFAVGLLLGSLALLRFLQTGTWLYRLDALLLGALLVYLLTQDVGDGTRMMWAFAYPLFFMFILGRREGAFWTGLFFLACICVLAAGMADVPAAFRVRFLAIFLVCSIFAYVIEGLRERFEGESQALIGQLETALSEVKTLKGLLPMCANCKKVRDDTGYWNQIESYLQDHADASFTHSVCPDCLQELYPEFVEQYMKPSNNNNRDESG
jgi:hypothetical protein